MKLQKMYFTKTISLNQFIVFFTSIYIEHNIGLTNPLTNSPAIFECCHALATCVVVSVVLTSTEIVIKPDYQVNLITIYLQFS